MITREVPSNSSIVDDIVTPNNFEREREYLDTAQTYTIVIALVVRK